jgi:catecholate siderophore receptor
MLSGRAGMVFKPLPQAAVYASYGTSLNPSLEGLSYNTANTVIDPEKSYTIETGSKWDFFGGRMLLSGAVFRVEKLNARTPGVLPGDPPQVLEGRQRVDGAELSVEGNVTRAWQARPSNQTRRRRLASSSSTRREIRSTFGPPIACLQVSTSAAARVSSIDALATRLTHASSMPTGHSI